MLEIPMPNMKKIKTKIKSVSNMKQITKALEVVATVKLQKTKKQTENYRDFMTDFLKIMNVVRTKLDILNTNKIDPNGRRLIIVVSSDKGLCGNLNSKLFKHVFQKYNDFKDNADVFCIGKKAFEFFARAGFNVVGHLNLPDDFNENDLTDVYDYIINGITKNKYAKIKVYFNYFKNTITQVPLRFKVYPIDQDSFDGFVQDIGLDLNDVITDELDYKDLIVEPDLKFFKQEMLRQFTQHMIYGAALQNKTGEFASRMLAMKNAKDNATDMIKSLKLSFNKARQSLITQEVTEIMSAKMAIED
ncbi:MAG TPA: ATP synthase F1 subunit gamma [Candidatus Absconditabacterales bacterium]|nr:ATP synthase F1 subunit gamma [Candidatus Absconditabacterales bacterium]